MYVKRDVTLFNDAMEWGGKNIRKEAVVAYFKTSQNWPGRLRNTTKNI